MTSARMPRNLLFACLATLLSLLLAACNGVDDLLPQQDEETATLSVNLAGAGKGTVRSSPPGIDCGSECVMSAQLGTGVVLTAAPATGDSFEGWSGACEGSGTTCALALDRDLSVTATFGGTGDDGSGDGGTGTDDDPAGSDPDDGPGSNQPDPDSDDDGQQPDDEPTQPGGDGDDDPSQPGGDGDDEPTQPGGDGDDEPAQPGGDGGDEPTQPDSEGAYARLVDSVNGNSTQRYDFFGSDIALSGDSAIVSAPFGEDEVDAQGAYFFERQGDDWVAVGHVEPRNMYGWGTPVAIGGPVSAMANTDAGELSSGTSLMIFERQGDGWELGAHFTGGDTTEQWSTIHEDVAVSGRSVLALVERNDRFSVQVYDEVNGVWQVSQELDLEGAEDPRQLYSSGEHLLVLASDSLLTFRSDGSGNWERTGELPGVGSGVLSDDHYATFENDGSIDLYRFEGEWVLDDSIDLEAENPEVSSALVEYALDGNDLVVATWDDALHLSPTVLTMLVYRRGSNGWQKINEFDFEDPEADARRGAVTLALDDGNLALGLERDTDDRGTVYFFTD